MTPEARQQIRRASDRARRNLILAEGGYSQIERTVSRVNRELERHWQPKQSSR